MPRYSRAPPKRTKTELEKYNSVIHASAKFIVLDKIIHELVVKQKKKVLIFSGFTRMLDCCEDFLHLRNGDGEQFKYVRLDGGTSRVRLNFPEATFPCLWGVKTLCALS